MTPTITLPRATVEQALLYDAETGIFTWLDTAWHKRNRGNQAGSKKQNGYIEIQFQGKMFKAHRLAWMLVYGDLADGVEIDHIDGDRSNNRLSNLRAVSRNINQQNQRKAKTNNRTGLLGVSKNGSGWKAELRVNGKKVNVGTYKTPELAYQAYVSAKRLHHRGCTI